MWSIKPNVLNVSAEQFYLTSNSKSMLAKAGEKKQFQSKKSPSTRRNWEARRTRVFTLHNSFGNFSEKYCEICHVAASNAVFLIIPQRVQVQWFSASSFSVSAQSDANRANKTIHALILEEEASSARPDGLKKRRMKRLIMCHRFAGMLVRWVFFPLSDQH